MVHIFGARPIRYFRSKQPVGGLEVKGHAPSTQEIWLSKNEILAAKNSPERFELMLVQVNGERAETLHRLRGYDFGEPGFALTRASFPLATLLQHAIPEN